MNMILRHFSNLNHHKPLGKRMLVDSAVPGQLYCCAKCISLVTLCAL